MAKLTEDAERERTLLALADRFEEEGREGENDRCPS